MLSRLAILAAAGFFLGGCVSNSAGVIASGIDAQFKLKRSVAAARQGAVSESPGVRTYQKVLSLTLGTHCHYFPSDSSFHVLVARRCGVIQSTLRSMSRSMNEYDAASMNLPILVHHEHIDFEDISNACGWI